jgi:hypothetical protein
MNNFAVYKERAELYQDTGIIVADEHDNILIRNSTGTYRAQRATSCLVKPEIGDLVLFCVTEADFGYILAILERKEECTTTISINGNLDLNVDSGSFSVTALDGVALSSPRVLSMISPEINVNATKGDVTVQRLTFTGNFFQATLKQIKLFADNFDSLLERLHQRIKRSYRFIEETDQLRADKIDHRAEELLQMHGKNAVINAKELIKLDGEQIHVG